MEFNSIRGEYGLDSLQIGIDRLFPELHFSLEYFFKCLWDGEFRKITAYLWENSCGLITGQLGAVKQIFVWLILMGVISALLTRFADVFDAGQIANLSFYYVYLLTSVVLLKSFSTALQIAQNVLEQVIVFIKLLMPTFLLAVGISTGVGSATAGAGILGGVVYGEQNIFQGCVLPAVYIYEVLALVNCIWPEEKLSFTLELLKKGVEWILKSSVALVTGFSIFQSAITPIVDSMKSSALRRTMSAIPGVGNVTDGIVDLVAGTALLVRNGIGAVLLILLLMMCVAPMSQIFLTSVLLKTAAAVMGIVSDKRITACVDCAGNAVWLVLKTAGTAVFLFFIVIAVVLFSLGIR
ncbi:MAG: stage III sporulation protein AE [Acetatifactor sp.]|nr:stage III sporulation protein AE [Acetatifactor sp.]